MIKVASSLDRVYGALNGLEAIGKAEFLGERYDIETMSLMRVFRPKGFIDNPTIKFGRDWYTTILKEYKAWREKWWREVIQNSVDAQATEIICEISQSNLGFTASCKDNGIGMSEETLLTKFLELGASGKKGEAGVVGGFGKAKELIILPWLSWAIHTNNTYATGSGLEYEFETAKKPIKGTEVSVLMPADAATHTSEAINVIKKSYLPHITFKVIQSSPVQPESSSEIISANLTSGKLLKSVETEQGLVAEIFYNDTKDIPSSIIVRTHGIYMFSMPIYSSEFKGVIVVEMHGKSTDYLTAHRDAFIEHWPIAAEIEKIRARLTIEAKSVMQAAEGLIKYKWAGRGKFFTREKRAKEESIRKMVEAISRGLGSFGGVESKVQLSPGVGKKIGTVIHEGPLVEGLYQVPEEEDFPDVPEPEITFKTPQGVIDVIVELKYNGPRHIETMINQLTWEPDFFLMNEIPFYAPPKTFFPDSMSRPLRKLARFWAELNRFVLIQLNCSSVFGVGWIFSNDSDAAYLPEEGDWLLLNPYKFSSDHKERSHDIWDLSSKEDVFELYANAVHECTHMADGVQYHNEAFSSALTRNFGKTSGKTKELSKILKAIKSIR